MGICERSDSFDISPSVNEVKRQDTLLNFPIGYSVCVTNPPWLAKNSATRRNLPFPKTQYDDLYKVALEKCLDNCEWIAALVPESFIRSGLFHSRLSDFVSLTSHIFTDTENPVGLALFRPTISKDIIVWRNSSKIGLFSVIESYRPPVNDNVDVRFNCPDGNVGLIAIDDTRSASIRFCSPKELEDYPIRHTCRSITKISVSCKVKIKEWNRWLSKFREDTQDVLMTSFKGIRQDGMYRRRMDWGLARGIISFVQ